MKHLLTVWIVCTLFACQQGKQTGNKPHPYFPPIIDNLQLEMSFDSFIDKRPNAYPVNSLQADQGKQYTEDFEGTFTKADYFFAPNNQQLTKVLLRFEDQDAAQTILKKGRYKKKNTAYWYHPPFIYAKWQKNKVMIYTMSNEVIIEETETQ